MDDKKSSTEGFERAIAFMREHARPVDQRLFDYYFNGGSAEDVLAELAHFQNKDGGFGHGLEPDFRQAGSSPMATSVGLQYAVAVGAAGDHPLVQGAIGYLVETFRPEGDFWPATFLDVNDAPHAPWWGMEAISPPADENWANPSAELTGYLHRYAGLVPDWLRERTAGKMAAVLTAGAFNPDFPFYNNLCWERAMGEMPAPMAAKIEAYLYDTYRQLHPLTEEKLAELPIIALAHSPESVVAQLYPEITGRLLDKVIGQQADDGGWWPGWAWGMYEEVWPVAQREWAGKLTLEFLVTLRKFGRL